MARYDYGYVRSWDDPKYVQQLYDQGYGGALFAMDDPRLPQLVAQAKKLGLQYGIWGAPNQTPDGREMGNREYADRMAQLAKQYGASVASLDLEFPYKGAKGSPEWQRSQELANYWKSVVPQGVQTWIAPLGSAWAGTQPQGDQMFNYDAWKGIATGWNPQAYGATLDVHQDPRLVVQSLINAGIDPSMISPLLAPGQNYGGGALYGLNEFGDLPKGQPPAALSRPGGPPAAPTSSTPTNPRRTGSGNPKDYLGGGGIKVLGRGASQSASQVRNQGLRYFGGHEYDTKQAFAQALAKRGQSYATWASQHAQAAKGLRGPAPKPAKPAGRK